MSTAERVVELLNSAALISNDAKITMLKQVQELIINKDPTLLNYFLDAIIAFQADKSIEVRLFVVNFIEEACKLDNRLLMRLIVNLYMLLEDENVNIVKKSILTMSQLYKVALKWVARSCHPSEHQESCWDLMTEMAMKTLLMLESDNDGIRKLAVRFVENLIITLSPRTSDSEVPKGREDDISLEQIPQDHPYLKPSNLQYIGKQALKVMLKFMVHPAISSINLIAALCSLASIARQRPMFMAEVIEAYETLHANLTPTLSESQVRSVKKILKLQLLSVLSHPSSCEYQAPICTLLLDLGSSQAEITRNMPPPRNSSNKRTRDGGDGGQKKSQADVTLADNDYEEDTVQLLSLPPTAPAQLSESYFTVEILYILLTPDGEVVNLVLIRMLIFHATYTPVESAGTDDQIRHLFRLMATEITVAGIGPGVEQDNDGIQEVMEEMVEKTEGPIIKRHMSNISKGQAISMVAASSTSDKEEGEKKVEAVPEIFIEEEEEAMPCKKMKVMKILEQPQSSSTQFPALEEPMDN